MTKILIGLLALCGLSQAMYLPGVAPNDYDQGSDVPLFVNSLTPMSNQQKSVLSYDYYDERFHFCSPEGGAKKQAESLGSVLFGDRIFTSAFKVSLFLKTHIHTHTQRERDIHTSIQHSILAFTLEQRKGQIAMYLHSYSQSRR